MVDIEVLSSSSSSSSSSGSDSSSSRVSSSTLSEMETGNGGEKMTDIHHGSSSFDALAANTNHSSSTKPCALTSKPANESSVPIEAVVFIDTDTPKSPLESFKPVATSETHAANDTPPSAMSLPHQEEDNDFPYFQSNDSLHTSSDKGQKENDDPYANGLLDQDLAKLLDYPEVLARMSPKPVPRETAQAYDSPSLDSSIATDDLEIPHSASPVDTSREEAASRFFQESKNYGNVLAAKSRVPSTAATTENVYNDYETPIIQSTATNEARTTTGDETLPLKQDQETVLVEPSPTLKRTFEVDPSLYQPPPYQHQTDPIVHHLSIHNRPKAQRQQIPVKDVFSRPLCNLWQFGTFNHLQSEVANTLAHSDDSIVVSAPTGSGKTALFEIAMARFFAIDLNACNGSSQQQVSHQRKIVYVAPSKALCEERFEDWTSRLLNIQIGIHCAMITGDAEPGDSFREVSGAHVILTTPEKWDSLTRRWTENAFLFGSVKLLLLDEVHLLGDGTRGCCLESIVCRMKTIQRAAVAASQSYNAHCSSSYTETSREALSCHLRIVGVSATLPNVSSIASFLEAHEAYAFDASYRPVPLTTHVVGLGYIGNNPFMFGKNLNRHVPDLIKRFSRSKPTIVFCHTKKETESLAMELSKTAGIGIPNNGTNMTLASQTKLTALQGALLRGIAYHHAGMDASDRKLVEQAFMTGKVLVLAATSTLAMGVNLPAHLVIIKGTIAWRGSGLGHQEIDTGTLLQMMGRAGRPGFDTSGTAVIMTDNASKPKYEKLSGGREVVDSHLLSRLMDVVNTDVSQRVITSVKVAQDWIKSTFFFRRAIENPSQYGLSTSEPDIEAYAEKQCLESLQRLSDEGIILLDESGRTSPLPACHIMSQNLVDFDAMKQIVNLPFDADQSVLLKFLSECERLHRPVRRNEKKTLNQVHKTIKYKLPGPPSKVRIQTAAEKAFVLLQAAIGQCYLEDFTLRQEMSCMVEFATRLLSAVEEYSIDGSMNGQVALQSLRLRRSLATSLWGPGDGVLNQLRGVGHKTTAKLRFSKISSFIDVLSVSSEEIERAAGREPPFGKELRIAVSKILKNTIKLSACVEYQGNIPKHIVCNLERRGALPGIEHVESDESAGIVKYTLIVYTDRPGGIILFQQNISSIGEYRVPFPEVCGKIFVHLIASMVGLDERLTLDGNNDVVEPSFTVAAPAKTNSAQKRQKTALLSPQGNDVRIKRRPAGQRKTTQQTIETTYAASQYSLTTSSKVSAQTATTKPMLARAPASASAAQAPPPSGATSVTPSPIPPPVAAALCERPARSLPPHSSGNGSQHLRGKNKSNWRQEKQSQKALQQSAFRRQGDNPFTGFSYDPNDMESSLVASAEKSVSPMPRNDSGSVIPAQTLSVMKQASATKAAPRSFKAGRYGASGRKGSSTGRGRRNRQFPKMADRDLLHMKAMEQSAYEAATMGYVHQAYPRQQFASNMVSQQEEYFVPQANYPSFQGYDDTFGPSESIFPPGYSIRGGAHGVPGFMGSLWHNEPFTANVWGNSSVSVTQSQPAFSQYMGEVNGPMNYSQVQQTTQQDQGSVTQCRSAFSPYMGEVNGPMNYNQVQQTTQQGQKYGDPYSWGQEISFNNGQQSMQDRAFGAQIPINDTRMYEYAAAPNEDEEDKLFSSAFG